MTPTPNPVSVARRPVRRFILPVLLVLLVIGAVTLAARVSQLLGNVDIPAGMPSGELAFVGDRDGTWDVYLLDPQGSIRNLTIEPEGSTAANHDYFVSWDFQAERLNFITSRTGELGPGQVQPDGSELRTLGIFEAISTLVFEGRLDWDPVWSPDGTRLAWSSLRDFNLELYTSASQPDAPVNRLTSGGARDWFPSWSPDGTRITFSSDRTGSEDIYLMNADGSNLRQITAHPATDTHPFWSLDGETLLLVSEREHSMLNGDLDIYVMPVAGTEADLRLLAPGEIIEADPIYAADGASLVYVSNAGGKWSLYQRDADGSNIRRLTDGSFNALFPVWRPQTGSAATPATPADS